MTDMGVNHVQLGNGETVIDLRGVTVNEDVLLEGYTAMDSKGNLVTGSASLQGGGSGEAVEEIFYVPFSFGETGFTLNGVTHAEILTAYNAGKRIIGKVYVPQAANLGAWGEFNIPMTCLQDNSTFTLAFISGVTSTEVYVASDNSVGFDVKVLQNIDSRVTSINSSSTHNSYPTAKAVSDALGGLTLKVATSAPTVDDRSVITFVVEE